MFLTILNLLTMLVIALYFLNKEKEYIKLIKALELKLDKVSSNNLEYFNELSRCLSSSVYFSRSVYYKHFPKTNTNNKNLKRN